MDVLLAHPWPGNVRELRDVLERAMLVARGPAIRTADLELTAPTTGVVAPTAGGPLRADVDALERQRIVDALARTNGNQSEAAKQLGTGRRTLLTKLDAFGIPRPRKGR